MNCGKMADSVCMLFGMVSRVNRGMGVLSGVEIGQEKGADFGVNVQCLIVTNKT